MLVVLQSLKALVEIAGWALLGQGVLYLLAGANRDQNIFYKIVGTITGPVRSAVRFVTPRFIADQHIGFLAFFLVLVAWLALRIVIVGECVGNLRHASCASLAGDYAKLCAKGVEDACDILERNQLLIPAPTR